MLLSAVASVVELKSESKKHKRGVAFFGSPDFFGIVPAFAPSSWAPTNFAASAWNPPITPDVALGQVQVQATHNVALQVRIYYTPCIMSRALYARIHSLYQFYTTDVEGFGARYAQHRISARGSESNSASKGGEQQCCRSSAQSCGCEASRSDSAENCIGKGGGGKGSCRKVYE